MHRTDIEKIHLETRDWPEADLDRLAARIEAIAAREAKAPQSSGSLSRRLGRASATAAKASEAKCSGRLVKAL